MASIRHLFEDVAPIRQMITFYCTATDLATFCHALPTALTETEKRKFLNPIRDLELHEQWITDRVLEGHSVALVSQDLNLLLDRIRRPSRYWLGRTNYSYSRIREIGRAHV